VSVVLTGDIQRDLTTVLRELTCGGFPSALLEAGADADLRARHDASALRMLDIIMVHAPKHFHILEPTPNYIRELMWITYRVWQGAGALQLGPYLINAHPIIDEHERAIFTRSILHIPSTN